MKIEILCTGDEILTGKTINTNFSYIAQKLTDTGLQVHWGTTVGDHRQSLHQAFQQASQRADAVIVNGGLGPTIDDLSQELAAEAAGVELELHEAWLEKLEMFYSSRGRSMPPNNRKQAMLPCGSEFIDNPIGTACGFAININDARFFFTPGVPRELRRMLNEQIIPRLLQLSGFKGVTRLKRFHSFGIGESRADELLQGIENLMPDSVKLGFQSHFPQLETKLAAVDGNEDLLDQALTPATKLIREKFGHFVLCEDEQTLEGLIVDILRDHSSTIATVEISSSGDIGNRLIRADVKNDVMHTGIVGQNLSQLTDILGLTIDDTQYDINGAQRLAKQLQQQAQTDYALAVLVAENLSDKSPSSAVDVYIAIAAKDTTVGRSARLMGGQDWVQLGSAEMALDAMRRYLLKLPLDEKIDFELQ